MDSTKGGTLNVARVAHSNGQRGNNVEHFETPINSSNGENDISTKVVKPHDGISVNFGSRTGRPMIGGTQLVLIEIFSGSTESHERCSGNLFTTLSDDCCSVNIYFNCNQGKGKWKLSLEDDYEKKVSGHNDAKHHHSEKVEDNFEIVKEHGWLDEWGPNLISLTGTLGVPICTTIIGVDGWTMEHGTQVEGLL